MRLEELKNIYFVCSGNTCRSPMGQRILIEHLNKKGKRNIQVGSRAAHLSKEFTRTASEEYSYMSPHKMISEGTKEVIALQYGDKKFFKNHVAKGFSRTDLDEADLVITMTEEHKEILFPERESWYDDGRLKVYTLGELAGEPGAEIPDPIGSPQKLMIKNLPDDARKKLGEIEKRSIPLKTAGFYFEDYFSKSQRKSMTIDAYMATFLQLDRLIGKIVELDEIPLQTISESILKKLQREHRLGKKYGSYKDSIQRGSGKYPYTPMELFDFGDYARATNEVNNAILKKVIFYQNVEDTFNKLANLTKDKKIKSFSERFNDGLRERVMSKLIMRSDYLTPGGMIDGQLIADQFEDYLIEFASYVPDLSKNCSLDLGLNLLKLIDYSLGIGEEMTNKKYRLRMLEKMLNLPERKEDQNESIIC